MIKNRIQATSSAVAVLGLAALGSGLLSATPAGAASQHRYQGKVVARSGLHVRNMPSMFGKVNTSVRSGQTVPLVCLVHGPTVGGNHLWYLLSGTPGRGGWAAARYIRNVGSAPRPCGTGQAFTIRTTAALNVRTGPTTKDARVQTMARGAIVQVTCKLDGQDVAGNRLWYQTRSGHWIAARYVRNIGRAPVWCD